MQDQTTASRPRASAPASRLSRFPVLATEDLEEARDAVARVYLDHVLSAPGGRLAMTLNAAPNRRFTLGYLAYGAAATLVMPPTEDCYHVNLTTAGQTRASRTDGRRATTEARHSGVVLLPDQENTVSWSPDAEQLILKISRGSLEQHLGDLLGRRIDAIVDFDFDLDLAGPQGEALLSSVEFFARELDRPGGLAEMPIAREQYLAFVMTQLLHAGRHPYSDELLVPADPLRRSRLRPVIEYMEAHAADPLTPHDLARVGCMSVRTLHATFQQTVGESPMNHLRRIRLDRARADLQRSDPQSARVTEIALRWGFLHQSRFAQQYRERFGERPSETLRGD